MAGGVKKSPMPEFQDQSEDTSIETVDTFNDDELVLSLHEPHSSPESTTGLATTKFKATREELPLPKTLSEFDTYRKAKGLKPNEFLGFLDNGILSTNLAPLERAEDRPRVRRSDSKALGVYKTILGKMFNKSSINITRKTDEYVAKDDVHTAMKESKHRDAHEAEYGSSCNQDPVLLRYFLCVTLFLIYNGVLIGALFYSIENNVVIHWCHGVGLLLSISILIYSFIIYEFLIKRFMAKPIRRNITKPALELMSDFQLISYMPWTLGGCLIISIVAFLIVDTQENRQRMISLLGVALSLILSGLFSQKHQRIKWRLIGFSMTLGFLAALLAERFDQVRDGLGCIFDKTQFASSQLGVVFLFQQFGLASGTFPIIPSLNVSSTHWTGSNTDFPRVYPSIFVLSMMSIYLTNFVFVAFQYLGVTKWLVGHIGGMGKFFFGLSKLEALSFLAFMVFGPMEAPLLIHAHLEDLTNSELHCIFTMGLISLSSPHVLKVVYVEALGLSNGDLALITLLTALCGVTVIKLLVPEISQDKMDIYSLKRHVDSQYQRNKDKLENLNVLDAALRSTNASTSVILSSIGHVMCLLSLTFLVDSGLQWLGTLFGSQHLDLGFITGKMFQPFVWFLGIPWEHCEMIGSLITGRLFRTDLPVLGKLTSMKVSSRSRRIALFAVANNVSFAGYGGMVATLGVLAPNRRMDIIGVSGKCFIAAFIATILSASLIGTIVN